MCSFLIIISVFLLSVLVSGSREDVRPFFSVFFFLFVFTAGALMQRRLSFQFTTRHFYCSLPLLFDVFCLRCFYITGGKTATCRFILIAYTYTHTHTSIDTFHSAVKGRPLFFFYRLRKQHQKRQQRQKRKQTIKSNIVRRCRYSHSVYIESVMALRQHTRVHVAAYRSY